MVYFSFLQVKGAHSWKMLWERDFWGHDNLKSSSSHKSWRPLCTATYRVYYLLAGDSPFWFHVTDRLLNASVSVLVLLAALSCFRTTTDDHGLLRRRTEVSAVLAACFFTVHPVHVEAVANSTGRAEVLSALCALSGFVFYTRFVKTGASSPMQHQCVDSATAVGGMLLFSFCSMLSKV